MVRANEKAGSLRRDHGMPRTSLPQSYFAIRSGCVTRVDCYHRDEIRRLRTELSLLFKIDRRAEQRQLGIGDLPSASAAGRYCDDDRRELAAILRDAAHPIIKEMIEVIDREFRGIREEIFMSAVNEEADRIVQEAAEAGVIESPTPDNLESIADPDAPSVEEALAAAEAELAALTGQVGKPIADDRFDNPAEASGEDQPAPTDSMPEASIDELADALASAAAGVTDEPDVSDEAPNPRIEDVTLAEPTPHAAEPDILVDGTVVGRDDSTPCAEEAQAEAPAEPEARSDACEPIEDLTPEHAAMPDAEADVRATADLTYTPDRAEQAVAEIEKGIRKLANLLNNEVSGQWKEAQQTFERLSQAQSGLGEIRQRAEELSADLRRMHEEARIARDDADVARREARLFREDARRAKERAETSASVAELAADQATREAKDSKPQD